MVCALATLKAARAELDIGGIKGEGTLLAAAPCQHRNAERAHQVSVLVHDDFMSDGVLERLFDADVLAHAALKDDGRHNLLALADIVQVVGDDRLAKPCDDVLFLVPDLRLVHEVAFRKKLTNCLSLFSSRKKWRYIGVWERSPEKNRLHFHGVFHVPDGTMPGELVEVNDYSFAIHQRQVTLQNTYFNKRFGRSDFELIDEQSRKAEVLAYILKYIEKTGEKVVYSKGLSQFFISDIMEEDVVCRVGVDDRKLLLFDDFGCWDEGCYVGQVSKKVIEQMRRCN